jgi:hypothetical protein
MGLGYNDFLGTLMEIGSITIDGMHIGVIEMNLSDDVDTLPDFEGYTPMGRAERGLGGHQLQGGTGGTGEATHAPHSHVHHEKEVHHKERKHFPGHRKEIHEKPLHDTPHDSYFDSDVPAKKKVAPAGKDYTTEPERGHTYRQGSAETDAAIERAARQHGLDPNFMRSVAHIESGMDPASNANARTQYKGLYQIGRDEWRRTGQGGNIYSAEDNAQAAGRLFADNKRQFHSHFGRDPTDTELYMMHQQGLGFYTRNALTNAGGNLPRGEHLDPADPHGSFERVWGRRVEAGKAAYGRQHPGGGATTLPPIIVTPDTMPEATAPMAAKLPAGESKPTAGSYYNQQGDIKKNPYPQFNKGDVEDRRGEKFDDHGWTKRYPGRTAATTGSYTPTDEAVEKEYSSDLSKGLGLQSIDKKILEGQEMPGAPGSEAGSTQSEYDKLKAKE